MPKSKLVGAFFQMDTVRGNRYLDDAGQIMNQYEAILPQMDVGIEGLRMRGGDGPIREMRVSTRQIWISFQDPDSLQLAIDHALPVVQSICEIIHVTAAKRFGLRTEFLASPPDMKELISPLANDLFSSSLIETQDKISTFETMLGFQWDDLHGNVRVRPVQEVRGGTVRENFGLMFDIDVYQEGADLQVNKLNTFLRSAHGTIKERTSLLEKKVQVNT